MQYGDYMSRNVVLSFLENKFRTDSVHISKGLEDNYGNLPNQWIVPVTMNSLQYISANADWKRRSSRVAEKWTLRKVKMHLDLNATFGNLHGLEQGGIMEVKAIGISKPHRPPFIL